MGQPPSSSVPRTLFGRPLLITVAAVVGLIVVGVVIWLLAAGGGGGPANAVRSFFDAAKAGDCDQVMGAISDPLDDMPPMVGQRACRTLTDDLAGAELDETRVLRENETAAQVELTMTRDSAETVRTLHLRRVGEEWKIEYLRLLRSN